MMNQINQENIQEISASPSQDVKLTVFSGTSAEEKDFSQCEVFLYYWGTLPFPIPPIYGLFSKLL